MEDPGRIVLYPRPDFLSLLFWHLFAVLILLSFGLASYPIPGIAIFIALSAAIIFVFRPKPLIIEGGKIIGRDSSGSDASLDLENIRSIQLDLESMSAIVMVSNLREAVIFLRITDTANSIRHNIALLSKRNRRILGEYLARSPEIQNASEVQGLLKGRIALSNPGYLPFGKYSILLRRFFLVLLILAMGAGISSILSGR